MNKNPTLQETLNAPPWKIIEVLDSEGKWCKIEDNMFSKEEYIKNAFYFKRKIRIIGFWEHLLKL